MIFSEELNPEERGKLTRDIEALTAPRWRVSSTLSGYQVYRVDSGGTEVYGTFGDLRTARLCADRLNRKESL